MLNLLLQLRYHQKVAKNINEFLKTFFFNLRLSDLYSHKFKISKSLFFAIHAEIFII